MSEARGRAERVLVVEDNQQNFELVEFLLSEAGMEVVQARDAASALREAAAARPDIVLVDVQLPGRDGLSLARELRAWPGWGTVPFVALTALALRGDRERLLAAGCTGYIPKPIDVSTFVATVLGYVRGDSP